jgi:hypothetical protein
VSTVSQCLGHQVRGVGNYGSSSIPFAPNS